MKLGQVTDFTFFKVMHVLLPSLPVLLASCREQGLHRALKLFDCIALETPAMSMTHVSSMCHGPYCGPCRRTAWAAATSLNPELLSLLHYVDVKHQ